MSGLNGAANHFQIGLRHWPAGSADVFSFNNWKKSNKALESTI
jgi:hypothetical protein